MKPFIWCCSWSPSRKSRWGSGLVCNGSILMLCPPVLWASMTMCSDTVVVCYCLCTTSLCLLLLRFLHSLCKKSQISATIESCEFESSVWLHVLSFSWKSRKWFWHGLPVGYVLNGHWNRVCISIWHQTSIYVYGTGHSSTFDFQFESFNGECKWNRVPECPKPTL